MCKEFILSEFNTLLVDYKNNNQALINAMYCFFEIQLDKGDMDDFYEAIIDDDDEQLAYYAAQPYLEKLWDKVLLLTPRDKDIDNKYIFFRKQTRVLSFHILIGFYIFSKLNINDLQSAVSQRYLLLGRKYHSIQCTDFYLRYLLERYKALDHHIRITKTEDINQIMSIASSQGDKYLTVGYIILAKYCWELLCINQNDELKLYGLTALYLAKKLEAQSINEIHNAYPGQSFDINGLKTIDALIYRFFQEVNKGCYDEKARELDEKARELSEKLYITIGMT